MSYILKVCPECDLEYYADVWAVDTHKCKEKDDEPPRPSGIAVSAEVDQHH